MFFQTASLRTISFALLVLNQATRREEASCVFQLSQRSRFLPEGGALCWCPVVMLTLV